MRKDHQKKARLRDFFSNLTKEELRVAETNFEGYLKVVARIYARLHNDPEILEILGFAATEEDSNQDHKDLRKCSRLSTSQKAEYHVSAVGPSLKWVPLGGAVLLQLGHGRGENYVDPAHFPEGSMARVARGSSRNCLPHR